MSLTALAVAAAAAVVRTTVTPPPIRPWTAFTVTSMAKNWFPGAGRQHGPRITTTTCTPSCSLHPFSSSLRMPPLPPPFRLPIVPRRLFSAQAEAKPDTAGEAKGQGLPRPAGSYELGVLVLGCSGLAIAFYEMRKHADIPPAPHNNAGTGSGSGTLTSAGADGDQTPLIKTDPNLIKIVLTGGPCGGKSSALKAMSKKLGALGYSIYSIPEVPTILMMGGCHYPGIADREALFEFESGILKLQLAMEDSFARIARSTKRKSVLIHDRGAFDIAAYMPPDVWHQILLRNGLAEKELFERYDLVLHLVTAADGAEKFYTLSNNEVRKETPEQARALDQKVAGVWSGHPRLRKVDNTTDFDQKMQRSVQHVVDLVLTQSSAAPAPASK